MLTSNNPRWDAAANAGVAAGRYIEDDTAPGGLRKGPNFNLPVDPDHASYQIEIDAFLNMQRDRQ